PFPTERVKRSVKAATPGRAGGLVRYERGQSGMRGVIDRHAYRLPSGELAIAVETWEHGWPLYTLAEWEFGQPPSYGVGDEGDVVRRDLFSLREQETGWTVRHLDPVSIKTLVRDHRWRFSERCADGSSSISPARSSGGSRRKGSSNRSGRCS